MSDLVFALCLAGALGAGLNAGVFFAFSTFVMPGLARLPAPQGIAAMQAINVAAITPLFMLALFGTGLVGLALLVEAALSLAEAGAPLRLAGSAIFLVGTVGVTIACNVPRNDRLAALDAAAAESAPIWSRYLRGWCAWNHVRTAASLAAAALLTAALVG